MLSIFFDLETSDREVVGQILNFSFIVCDSSWNIINELSGEIKATRLQIPSPGAILANRIDLIKHQKTAPLSEAEAAQKIAKFLEEVANSSQEKVAMIGFNSFKFDIPYLRTVLIRNGISPYIATQKIIHRDLLCVAQKLAATAPDFIRGKKIRVKGDEQIEKLSLKLEHLCNAFGLLEGKQLHESRSDVLITIELAKAIKERFGVDVRTYEAYEGTFAHRSSRSAEVFVALEPEYDLSKGKISREVPISLLDCDRRYALWINLEKYIAGKGNSSIEFYKFAGSGLVFKDQNRSTDSALIEQAKKAQAEFKSLTLQNFFSASTCDIEYDIYRLDFDCLNALNKALWFQDRRELDSLKNRDLVALFVRSLLAKQENLDTRAQELLRQYALYRYGGKMIASKQNDPKTPEKTRHHPTLRELISDLETSLAEANEEDRSLLLSLKKFIEQSDIMRLAGQELLGGSGQVELTL